MDLDRAGHYIWQDVNSQPVSQASDALQKAALEYTGKENPAVLELGSGNGIVSIMIALKHPTWKIDAIEIQPKLHVLSLANAALCGVEINFICGDLRKYHPEVGYDLIISNPPWQKRGTGRQSKHSGRNVSRQEILCSMPDILGCVHRSLSRPGEAILIYPTTREDELRRETDNTLLDIISVSQAPELKEEKIFRIRHKGNSL